MARAGAVLVATLQMLEGENPPGRQHRRAGSRQPSASSAHVAALRPSRGYRGFPGSICASPNAMVVHGIPGPYRLKRGDIVSIDVGGDARWLGGRCGANVPGRGGEPAGPEPARRDRGVAARRRRRVPPRESHGRRPARSSKSPRTQGWPSWSRLSVVVMGSDGTRMRPRRCPTTASQAGVRCWRRDLTSRSADADRRARAPPALAGDGWAI